MPYRVHSFALALSTLLFVVLPARADDTFSSVPDLPESTADQSQDKAGTSLPFTLELKGQIFATRHRQPPASGSETNGGSRLSARMHGNAALSDSSTLLLNSRLYTEADDNSAYSFSSNTRLIVQEAAFQHLFTSESGLTVGRVNVRNGVASGFNPTDWFRKNSLVRTDSLDVKDRREDRLGIVAVQGMISDESGLWQAGYRPRIPTAENSILSDRDIIGQGLDRTNDRTAFYLKYTPSHWDNLALTPSLYYEENNAGLGMESSITAHDTLVLYGEWFVQRRMDLAAQALDESAAFTPLFADRKTRLYNQLAVGASWSMPENIAGQNDITLSLEYHFNEAGLDAKEHDRWKRLSHENDKAAGLIAKYAADAQEPLARHQIFTRLAWNDIVGSADLSLIAALAPVDGSGFSQATLQIPLTENAHIDVQGYHFFGSRDSIYGSGTTERGINLSLVYNL